MSLRHPEGGWSRGPGLAGAGPGCGMEDGGYLGVCEQEDYLGMMWALGVTAPAVVLRGHTSPCLVGAGPATGDGTWLKGG